jgi:hypothetical protein
LWHTLKILTVAVGVPYFVLSTSNPLMQAWRNTHQSKGFPYSLYALSNAGALLGLVTFPFLIEPTLPLRAQASLWTWGYAAFALCAACSAIRTMRLNAPGMDNTMSSTGSQAWPRTKGPRPGAGVRILWVAFSACASVLLLATTNQTSLEMSATPFLWVLSLALYLLSFVLCFSGRRWYSRSGYTLALMVGTVLFCSVYCYGKGTLLMQIGIYSLILFVCCMICHGELARLKPHPSYLTLFYLLISIGGMLGGIAVNLVAPVVFSGFWELPVGLVGCWALLLIAFAVSGDPDQEHWAHLLNEWLFRGLEIGIVLLSVLLFSHTRNSSVHVQWSSRSFFGVSWVKEINADTPVHHARALVHSGTVHGFQYLDEEKRKLPTAYFTEESGVGLAFLNHPRHDDGLRVGAVGLGIGTLVAYGCPGDSIRFYEINPDVIRLAEGEGGYFTYLQDSLAQIEIVPGDARVSMEWELAMGNPQNYDLLVVDAFNSGTIPLHLLTKEAFSVYLNHLQPDGVIALHISNQYIDLRPVVQGLADHFQLGTAFIINDGADDGRGYWSAWMLVTRSDEFLEHSEIAGHSSPQPAYEDFGLWTDDHSSLLPILLSAEPLSGEFSVPGSKESGLLGNSDD